MGGNGGASQDALSGDLGLKFADVAKKPDGSGVVETSDASSDGKDGHLPEVQPPDAADAVDAGTADVADADQEGDAADDTVDVTPLDVGNCKAVTETCNGVDDDCDGATDESCDDGEPCTVQDICASGDCAGVLMDCNDNDKCTADGCTGGTCGHPLFSCDDNNPCTNDGCAPLTGCTHTATSDLCDDGNPCTELDDCSLAVCLGKAKNCDDGNVCTNDACDTTQGCKHTSASGACEDGNPCTTGESCSGGSCGGGTLKVCNDGNSCTSDGCDATGCVYTPQNGPCEDGNACTSGDACAGISCQAGNGVTCVDNNPCTDDACQPASGCAYTANSAGCDDGSVCTTNDVCANAVCAGSSICAAGTWCDGLGGCPACDTAAHCGATCEVCGGATPDCDSTSCVCNSTSCPANQTCSGVCSVCKTDGACGASCSACGGGAPKCLDQGTSSTCVACLATADCPAGWECVGNACSDSCQINLTYDFETNAQGFTHAPTSGIASDDPWVNGAPTGVKCHGGKKCWATDLAVAGYKDCQMAELRSPTLDLSSCTTSAKTLTVQFWHYYKFEPFSTGKWWDGGVLQVSKDGGATWSDAVASQAYQGLIQGSYDGCTPTPDINGHTGWSGEIPAKTWAQVTWTVPSDYRVKNFAFRWLFGADANTTDRGWFLDDVSVVAQ